MKTALLVLFCTAIFGQNRYKPPRTPYGQPDLQGVWDFRTITPLERSEELGTKAFFTAEEAAKYEQEENRRQNRDLIDPKQGGSQYPPGGVVPYNEFWYDRGNKVTGTKRTSLIVDPADGRLPQGRRLLHEKLAGPRSPLHSRSLWDRLWSTPLGS